MRGRDNSGVRAAMSFVARLPRSGVGPKRLRGIVKHPIPERCRDRCEVASDRHRLRTADCQAPWQGAAAPRARCEVSCAVSDPYVVQLVSDPGPQDASPSGQETIHAAQVDRTRSDGRARRLGNGVSSPRPGWLGARGGRSRHLSGAGAYASTSSPSASFWRCSFFLIICRLSGPTKSTSSLPVR